MWQERIGKLQSRHVDQEIDQLHSTTWAQIDRCKPNFSFSLRSHRHSKRSIISSTAGTASAAFISRLPQVQLAQQTASTTMKRKLSCIILEKRIPKHIVKYCLEPYFQSRPFDSVVAQLQYIFVQHQSHSGFTYSCHDFNLGLDGYTSMKQCILTRIRLSNKFITTKQSDAKNHATNQEIRVNLKRLRHNTYNQL